MNESKFLKMIQLSVMKYEKPNTDLANERTLSAFAGSRPAKNKDDVGFGQILPRVHLATGLVESFERWTVHKLGAG